MAAFPEQYLDIFKKKAFAAFTTLMPDGGPQTTPVWVDYQNGQIWVNSALGRQKDKNVRRDPRVAVTIIDADNPYRYVEVRGRVSGYVEKWLFKPGQEVRAGDVLYVLDQRPYEAALLQAKGNLAQSEADLEFAQKQVAVLQAEASLAVAKANLVKAQQDVQRLEPLVKQDAAPKQVVFVQ